MASRFQPPPLDQLATVDLAKCLYESQPTEIVGLVSEDSQSGWPRCPEYDVHILTLAAWRRTGQPVTQQDMVVLRPVPKDSNFDGKYPAGSIHRFRLLLATDGSRAVFAECVECDVADADLQQAAVELRKPLIVQSSRLGPLTLVRKLKRFEGKAVWNGKLVDISIEPDKRLDISKPLQTAEALFGDAVEWERKVNQFAVSEMLDLANDWHDDTGPNRGFLFLYRLMQVVMRKLGLRAVSRSKFLKRMQLSVISIKRDGAFEFWHSDGDLFYGHSIMISGSLAEGLTQADIPG